MSQTKEWFEDWFSSSYYDLLYSHRDEKEAALFLEQLLLRLNLKPEACVWDLACGKGRHAKFLADKGFQVIGTDLSEPFICYANQFKRPGLEFLRQDMRSAPPRNDFDIVLNLFTAFGYFNDQSDDLLVLQQVYQSLKPGGILVLDYINIQFALNHLIPTEVYHQNGMEIKINRAHEGNRITKKIEIWDNGVTHHFQESIHCLYQADFVKLFSKANFRILECWGNYNSMPFEDSTSERMVWIVQKPE